MTVCLPKFYVCNTYSTGFVPGPTPCFLQDTAERRGRLSLGGTFFRSIGFGIIQNNITITCDWLGSTPPSPSCTQVDNTLTPTTNQSLVTQVKLTVSNGITTEIYYACQSYDGLLMQWTSAIPSLRTQVNASSTLINMPSTDGISGYNAAVSEIPPLSHIDYFSVTNLGGAGPPGPSPSMRTGPVFTLLHFASTEDGGGNAVGENIVKFWDSQNWSNLSGYTCYDPNNLPPNCCINPLC